jgi:DNA-binding response OmpR family regulator
MPERKLEPSASWHVRLDTRRSASVRWNCRVTSESQVPGVNAAEKVRSSCGPQSQTSSCAGGSAGRADRYLGKPVDPERLEQAVRDVLVRYDRVDPSRTVRLGSGWIVPLPDRVAAGRFAVDWPRRTAFKDEVRRDLTETEFRILHCLVAGANQVFDPATLAGAVREEDEDVATLSRNLPRYIYTLRAKIEPEPGQPRFLRTQPRAGYLLDPEG